MSLCDIGALILGFAFIFGFIALAIYFEVGGGGMSDY